METRQENTLLCWSTRNVNTATRNTNDITVETCYNTVNWLQRSTITPYKSPSRDTYGVFFMNLKYDVQCSAVITRSIFSKYSQRTPHSSPARARYGVSFVDPKSGWHFDAFLVIIHVICYNIRPRYNGTPLYLPYSHCCGLCNTVITVLHCTHSETAFQVRKANFISKRVIVVNPHHHHCHQMIIICSWKMKQHYI